MTKGPAAAHAHGGARAGAGRKRTSRSVSHAARPAFTDRQPLHLTVRMAKGVWNLRSQRGLREVNHALAAEQRRGTLRVVHYSVQGNHLHLIAEADDAATLSRRMQGFGIRLAKRINRLMGRRRGRVLGDRYHLHVLRSSREVRNAIRYVLLNHVKHYGKRNEQVFADPFSSGSCFAHWAASVKLPTWSPREWPLPIASPRSWLLRLGWLRQGPIAPSQVGR